MPIWGLIIKTLASVNSYKMLSLITCFFCVPYNTNNKKYDSNKIRILALSDERFRQDLQILDKTGRFQIWILPYNWMCRVLFTFYKAGTEFEDIFYNPINNHADRKRVDAFLHKFLPVFNRDMKIDAVVTAALHYRPDYVWGSNSSLTGTPFIVFHRESFLASKKIQDKWLKMWPPAGELQVDLAIIMSEPARQIFIQAGIITEENSINGGTLRMDGFIEKYHHKKVPLPEKKQITLFSFRHGIGLAYITDQWYYPIDSQPGFAQLFEDAHSAFAEFAKENPEVECVIKIKWGGIWVEEIDKTLARNNLNREDIPNLRISDNDNVHKLIEDSHVICSFGSTTLLESIIVGDRPIIVTMMGEANREDYQDKILMPECKDVFDAAYTKEEFKCLLTKGINGELPITPEIQKKREVLFERWSSPLNDSATSRYTAAIENLVKEKLPKSA